MSRKKERVRMGRLSKKINKKINNVQSITLRPLFRKIVGWDELQNSIDTIHFFLNQVADISSLPKATGILRQVQLADTELLRIVTDILTNNRLSYWLDYGTLLGAVRHKGFIPWDDDLDIAMPREDYDKAMEILPKELGKIDINYSIGSGEAYGRLFVTIYAAGLVLDIVPYDNVSKDSFATSEELQAKIAKCRYYYRKHQNKSHEIYRQNREKMIGSYVKDDPIWFQCPEWGQNDRLYDDSVIFPLRKIKFEDYDFFVPNNYHEYLSIWYGEYMDFPKSGVLHHKGTGKGIHNQAKKNGIDLKELIAALQAIRPLEL